MKADEVQAIMAGYLVGTGLQEPNGFEGREVTISYTGDHRTDIAYVSPEGEVVMRDATVYRHNADSADWGIVRFKESKVVEVSFHPD
ncbi:hypothetical protein ACFL6U_11020 [Planctomycetota bacterium]